MNILVVSGSVRLGRRSHRVAIHLVNTLQQQYPEHTVTMLDLAEYKLPVMEAMYANHPNPPAGIDEVYNLLNSADAMLFVTPEYNGHYSPALSNMLDYFEKKTFEHKALGIVTVSNGAMAGMRSSQQMQLLSNAMFMINSPYMLLVGNVTDKFDEEGNLLQPEFEKNINFFFDKFTWLAQALKYAKQAA